MALYCSAGIGLSGKAQAPMRWRRLRRPDCDATQPARASRRLKRGLTRSQRHAGENTSQDWGWEKRQGIPFEANSLDVRGAEMGRREREKGSPTHRTVCTISELWFRRLCLISLISLSSPVRRNPPEVYWEKTFKTKYVCIAHMFEVFLLCFFLKCVKEITEK